MIVLLETERLRLRRFVPTDAAHLIELDSDPAVMRYLTGGAPTPADVIESEILARFLERDERGFGFWAAVEKTDDTFVGWFSLRPSRAGVAELGYRLRRSVWGRGYATEVVRCLIRKAFVDLGVRRLVATTYEANLASRRVAEKAGLRLVRTYRMTAADLERADTYRSSGTDPWDGNDLEYALDKWDWEQQNGGRGR